MIKLHRVAIPAFALLAGAVFGAPVAHAQMDSGIGASGLSGFGQAGRAKPEARKPELQPQALPGAKSTGGPAPATKAPTDMPPTDALFDAINRGDIAAARDAISRGADLNGRNVLGMTPMELSVDLGRNDISFLLLSMRAELGPRRPGAAPAGQATAAAKTPARSAAPARAEKAASSKAVLADAATAAAPAAPRLFAHDGGAPIPSLGFLGFDPVR